HRAIVTGFDLGRQAAADLHVAVARSHDLAHAAFTLPARPSRKARMRPLAAPSPCAIAAISDSTNKPSDCERSAMRGSACITAKFDSGAFVATLCARASAVFKPMPGLTRYCEIPRCWPSSAL